MSGALRICITTLRDPDLRALVATMPRNRRERVVRFLDGLERSG